MIFNAKGISHVKLNIFFKKRQQNLAAGCHNLDTALHYRIPARQPSTYMNSLYIDQCNRLLHVLIIN